MPPATELASSLPPSLAMASLTECAYQTYPPGFYVGMGFLLGLLVGYAWFRLDAAAWWRAYRRTLRAEAKAEQTKDDSPKEE